MIIDKRRWTMSVEVVGVFRGPRYKPGDHILWRTREDAVERLLHQALVQMEAAANQAGTLHLEIPGEIDADCCLRLHFRDPSNMRTK